MEAWLDVERVLNVGTCENHCLMMEQVLLLTCAVLCLYTAQFCACWGCRSESGLASSKSRAGRVQALLCGMVAGCAKQETRNLGMPRGAARLLMWTSSEERVVMVLRIPLTRRLKAAGNNNQGFQGLCWMPVWETSFQTVAVSLWVLCTAPLNYKHFLRGSAVRVELSACPWLPACVAHHASFLKQFLFLMRLPGEAPPQPRQITYNSWIMAPDLIHRKVLIILFHSGSKAATVRTCLYKLWKLSAHKKGEFRCTQVWFFMFFPQLCKWITACVVYIGGRQFFIMI